MFVNLLVFVKLWPNTIFMHERQTRTHAYTSAHMWLHENHLPMPAERSHFWVINYLQFRMHCHLITFSKTYVFSQLCPYQIIANIHKHVLLRVKVLIEFVFCCTLILIIKSFAYFLMNKYLFSFYTIKIRKKEQNNKYIYNGSFVFKNEHISK